MKTAGVVFDFYDDPSGALLKKTFPKTEDLPEIIKTAHFLNQDEHQVLRDEAFALVMVNEGKVLRKFACVDAGNTALSSIYFLANGDKLPEEAQGITAVNIEAACEEFGLPVNPSIKVAAAMYRRRDSMQQPLVGDEADWAQRTNMVSIRGGADSGRVIPTANQMKTAASKKATLTKYTAHERTTGQEPDNKGVTVGEDTPFTIKSAEVMQGGEILTNDTRDVGVKQKAPAIQHRKVHSIVDVTGKTPEVKLEKKSSQRTALDGKYSLDSYSDVQKAVEFFSERWTEMAPEDRHGFCVKTAARANELGIDIPELMERYGSSEYAPDVDAHLATRRAVSEPNWHPVFNDLKEKRASIPPEEFAKLLETADKAAGLNWYWGGQIADPWLSTFGGDSEKTASLWSWMGRTGDYVTGEALIRLARNGRGAVHKMFSSDITNAFQKDPINIFLSMPDDKKVLFARLANDMTDALAGN